MKNLNTLLCVNRFFVTLRTYLNEKIFQGVSEANDRAKESHNISFWTVSFYCFSRFSLSIEYCFVIFMSKQHPLPTFLFWKAAGGNTKHDTGHPLPVLIDKETEPDEVVLEVID